MEYHFRNGVPSFGHAAWYFVAKLVKSFGRLGDSAESLDDFRHIKPVFSIARDLTAFQAGVPHGHFFRHH